MYGAVVERGIIRAADQKKYIVETLDRKGIESLQITALNGAPFAVGDIVYFFLFPDGTGKIICSEAANDTTGFVVDANYVHTDNNYTDEEKAKLADIDAEAQKNVQSDWNAKSGDAFIKNKPTIPEKVSELENDSGFVNSTEAAAAAPVKSVNGKTGDVNVSVVDLPVSVQDGGTGAGNAEDARTNLGLGNVATENVVPLNKGGTGATTAAAARTNLGLGSVATENVVPLSKGGTGATTAAAARTNLGAIAMPTVINLSTTSSSSSYSRTVTVSGSGVVVVYCGLISTATSDYGTYQAEIYHNGTKIMAEGCRTFEAMAQIYGSSTSVPIAVSNGNTIKVSMTCTKNASVAKPVYLRFLCFGCTVS